MQIAINISHNLYESIMKDYALSKLGEHELYKAVQKGTPLPKEHDRLIEANSVDKIVKPIELSDAEWGMTAETAIKLIHDAFNRAPTIIPATKDTEKEFAESIIALIPHLPTESDKARMQTATKEGE